MHTHMRPRRPKLALWAGTLASFLAVGTIVAAGCGEAAPTKPSGVATSTDASPTASTTGTTSTTQEAASRGSSASGQNKTPAGRRHRSRVPLALPGPNSHQAPTLTPAQRAHVSIADITLSSPAITQARVASTPTLGRSYTCQGADRSPPLRWKGVPAGTRELVLFAISTKPVQGKLFFDWAVAKLDPALKGIDGGSLPAGAIVGRSGSGREAYSICPSGGERESYVFALYALARSLSPRPGFDPASLRQQAMSIARHTGLLVGSYG